jgi:hypothetical protein
MSYRIAGIDVHKKMLAVVVSDVEIESEYQFERRMFGSNPEQLRSLAAWLLEQEAEEVVMESTAQYWKPVWETLERYWKPIREKREGAGQRSGTLHLAQAESNRARRGRKRDFADAERLVKRLVRVEECRCALDFPWLCPPFPASCPVRSIITHRELPPHGSRRADFPQRVLQA